MRRPLSPGPRRWRRGGWLGRSLEHGLADAAGSERAVDPGPSDVPSVDLSDPSAVASEDVRHPIAS